MAHRPHNFRALSKPKHLHKREHRHYLPYLPLFLILLGSFLVFAIRPVVNKGVLAYATNMSVDQLLASTNQQRSQSGSSTLKINQNLNSAAQAKANDMVARNYWSHNTPEGEEPWIFLNNAGYKYLRAGENLAYGFDSSDDTVIGWMNSPPHKSNLLDTNFTEVGFGFANGQNFNDNGPETVVVAMYGKPQVLAASSQSSSEAPAPVPAPSKQNSSDSSVPDSTANTSSAAPAQAPDNTESTSSPVTTDQPVVKEPNTTAVTKVQTQTNGKAPWTMFAVGLVVGVSLVILLVKHAAGVRHFFKDGEQFVLHHPILDTLLVCLVLGGSFLSQTTGFIR